MIQRIQSLYLLVAALLTVFLFFSPVASLLYQDNQVYSFSIAGITGSDGESIMSGFRLWPLWTLAVLNIFLMLFSIFLFRRRETQMRIVVYTAILLAGFEGMMFFYIHHFSKNLSAAGKTFHYPILFPVIGLVLLILAVRAIRKDELLATAYQRLR